MRRALCLTAAVALLACGAEPPATQRDAELDPTAQLPARFKTQEEVAKPDFSAAAATDDFRRAVDEAAALLGATPGPLISHGEEDEVAGGVSFAVPQARAEAVLLQAHTDFLARGFSLFRCERGFGIGGAPDVVGLLPTADKFAVMAAMRTNGDNYGIGTAGVIAWLRELESEHPYQLTGIGFDFVEGRFTAPIESRDALARRLYQFCPDLVTQCTGTVDALADELRTGELFLWWD